MDLKDEMSMFNSKPKNFGTVIKERDIARSEQSHQLEFCKWVKHEYPSILFRSDIYAGMERSPIMQNIKQILDPYSGWPDVMIFYPRYINGMFFVGLGIELKSENASLSGAHYQNQLLMHQRLRDLGYIIEVAKGCEAAKKVFLEYVK